MIFTPIDLIRSSQLLKSVRHHKAWISQFRGFSCSLHCDSYISLTKFEPWSLVQAEGTPYRATWYSRKACAQVLALVSLTGSAENSLVVLSTVVRRCLYPWLSGNGPTMSKCICENLVSGTSKWPRLGGLNFPVFADWQPWHVWQNFVISSFIFVQ